MGLKLTPEQISQYEKDGFLILPNFLTPEEVDLMKEQCDKFIDEVDLNQPKAFYVSGTPERPNEYYLESGDKIHYFFEKSAFDEKGNLIVEKKNCLNRIAHGLHVKNPIFKKMTLSKKVQDIARDLGFVEPAVIQGIVIFKNPRVGSEVACHQDATFFYTDPVNLMGYWYALEDATVENGCLWLLPGSHKGEIYKRYVRDSEDKAYYVVDHKMPSYEESELVPAIAPKGSCVLIHGKVLHKSDKNSSDKPRPIYTFHITETRNTTWRKDNWLRPPTRDKALLPLYTTSA